MALNLKNFSTKFLHCKNEEVKNRLPQEHYVKTLITFFQHGPSPQRETKITITLFACFKGKPVLQRQ